MSRNIIKTCTAYLLFLYSFAYAVSAYSANNSIYQTQAGGSSALTMNIDQIGGSNVIGTSNARVSLTCLLYTSPSPRDRTRSRMPSSA